MLGFKPDCPTFLLYAIVSPLILSKPPFHHETGILIVTSQEYYKGKMK